MNNAKNLIKGKVEEAGPGGPEHSPDAPPSGRSYPPIHTGPLRRPPSSSPPAGDPVRRMVGQDEPPKGQFTLKETSQLKDVLIMMLAHIAHSSTDAEIGQALMNGQELDPGQLQHILDEARQLQIPDSHGTLLQKIFTKLQQR